jgi:hypothetical protein
LVPVDDQEAGFRSGRGDRITVEQQRVAEVDAKERARANCSWVDGIIGDEGEIRPDREDVGCARLGAEGNGDAERRRRKGGGAIANQDAFFSVAAASAAAFFPCSIRALTFWPPF